MHIFWFKRRCGIGAALGLAVATLSLPGGLRATSTVNIHAGLLRQDATTAIPTGALLLLVAAGGSGGTTFSNAPTAGNYVSGNDIILNAFAFNANGGTIGTGSETRNNPSIAESFYTNGLSSGTYLELLWFPTITYAQYSTGTKTVVGTVFGAYNPKLDQPTQSLAPDGGQNWTVPSDGGSPVLYFLTTDDTNTLPGGGSQPKAEGYANYAVVPEPSTVALLGSGLVGLAVWHRRRRRGCPARLGRRK